MQSDQHSRKKNSLTIFRNLDALTLFATDTGSNKMGTFASFATDYRNPNRDSRHDVKTVILQDLHNFFVSKIFKVERGIH